LKQTIYSISGAVGVNRVSALFHRRRPIILTFHGVTSDLSDPVCNAEGLHLHRPIFERLMEHVARNYRAVSVARVVDWLEGGATVPERAVAITFDDGFRNVLTDAAPVLKRLHIPATLFVSTDFVFNGEMLWPDRLLAALQSTREARLEVEIAGQSHAFDIATRAGKLRANQVINAACKRLTQDERLALVRRVTESLGVDAASLSRAWEGFRPIDPDELEQLPGFGITVGAHTCSHPILALLSAADQARELAESKRLIESVTAARCDEFAYPNGGPHDFNDQTKRAAMEAGYRCAFTTIKRRVSAGDDPFEIPRCTLTHNQVTLAEFSAELSGFPGKLRALRSIRDGSPARVRKPELRGQEQA
jgi:peptidoglycan/xylan/chitin deacetylase (PgdA/CDA1 family)